MTMDHNNQKDTTGRSKPLRHGVILVAGGAVGAGMFALPLVSAGAWFSWSVAMLLLVCWLTYLAASLLIDVNIKFPAGSSFDTLVRAVLGRKWARLNNLSIAFIMFVLMYAYITAGAGILSASLSSLIESEASLPRPLMSLLFAFVIGALLWFGTSMVSQISTLLMIGMCLTFLSANSGLIVSLDPAFFFLDLDHNVQFIWSAVPVFVTAFACAGLVPSLSAHYSNHGPTIKRSVLLGLLLALAVYLIWLTATLGSISRSEFVAVAEQGGGLSALLNALQNSAENSLINRSLTWFSHFAVITSFLSIGLGLVHFLADHFSLNRGAVGQLQAILIAFVPPLFASLVAPYGFVSAIAYAGLFVAFSFLIVPALMHAKLFAQKNRYLSGRGLAVGMFGVLVMILKLLSILGLLPTYP